MKKTKLLMIWIIVLVPFQASNAQAKDDVSVQAAKHYAEKNWLKAIESYDLLTKVDANNERAWFRLASSYINLMQGEQAINANAHLVDAKNIPAAFVLYQKAQALGLTENTDAMWKVLKAAADKGYGNLINFQSDSIFKPHQDTPAFKKISQVIDKNARPCMYDDTYRAFDFWLGEWEVYTSLDKKGSKAGHNSITRAEDGCLIIENWQGAGGTTGTSMNYYDGIKEQWVQRWVSGGGTVIEYAGGLIEDDGKNVMRLVGEIYYASKLQRPQVRDFRGTWTPLEGGVVQQFFEESVDGGKTWYSWFNGFYFPTKEVDKNAK